MAYDEVDTGRTGTGFAVGRSVRSPLRFWRLLGLLVAFALATSSSAIAQRRVAKGKTAKAHSSRSTKPSKRSRKPTSRKAQTSLRGAKLSASWKSRRVQNSSDTGLKNHASRHSELSPKEYLALGKANISHGRALKGSGRNQGGHYHIRKLPSGEFSMTITNARGKILSIDTWKSPGAPLTKAAIERGLSASGVTPPKKFWSKL